MCAIIECKKEKPELLVSDGKVYCYKYYNSNNNKLESYYSKNTHKVSEYEIGKTYKDKIVLNKTSDIIQVKNGKQKEKSKWESARGFHSTTSLSECIRHLEEKVYLGSNSVATIVRCRIPKDSKYYLASEDFNYNSSTKDVYVSESLELIEELVVLKGSQLSTSHNTSSFDILKWSLAGV